MVPPLPLRTLLPAVLLLDATLAEAQQRVVPYPYIREADAMWCRRVWREIDLSEKINLPYYYPLEPANGLRSLFDVLKDALLTEGAITAYSTGATGQDDAFNTPLTVDQVKELLVHTDTVFTEDLNTGELVPVVQRVAVSGADIKRYRIKEDWVFDRQRSVMDIRIIGLAPMRTVRGDDGEVRGFTPLFWLYFPELRYVLVNAPAFNPWNDAERRSFDHLFLTRAFSSRIVKVSNVYDRSIAEYRTGVDGLLEGEAIKQELFDFEHDLWHY